MRLTAVSGLGSKGPACFLLEIDGKRILLDLGKGPDGDRLPNVEPLGTVDAIVFSHGHVDHTGGLHLAERLGNPPLFAPEPSIALSLDGAFKAAEPYEKLSSIKGITFDTGSCGHAPGASWVRFGGERGLLYTGDLSNESTLYRQTALPRAEALVFDASYGIADTPLCTQIAALLAEADRPLLLPAPAGGRGLEMALVFADQGHKVSLCPAHRRVAQTMLTRGAWLTKGGAEKLSALLEAAAPLTVSSDAAGIMIASGPNAERDVTQALAPRFIAEASAKIIFTGHVSSGTPAKAMVDQGDALFLRWNVHPRLTQIRAILSESRAKHAMPAFCTAEAQTALAAALDFPLTTTPEMTW